jgi:transposase
LIRALNLIKEGVIMAKPLVSDELWALIEPLLPKHEPSPLGGRPPLEDRKVLAGIIFVLRTGIPWEDLPQEMGCGAGMTCWRRLHEWQALGIWKQLQQILLDRLRGEGQLDFSRVAADSGSIRAVGAGEKTGPNPTDRGKPGTKHHVLADGHGLPLNVLVTGANEADVSSLLPLVDGTPEVAGKRGHPRKRPGDLYADRAYDSERHRRELRQRGIQPHLARRGQEHGSGLGVFRWVAEWLVGRFRKFRRLRVRDDRRADIHEAFITLACCLIYLPHLA